VPFEKKNTIFHNPLKNIGLQHSQFETGVLITVAFCVTL